MDLANQQQLRTVNGGASARVGILALVAAAAIGAAVLASSGFGKAAIDPSSIGTPANGLGSGYAEFRRGERGLGNPASAGWLVEFRNGEHSGN